MHFWAVRFWTIVAVAGLVSLASPYPGHATEYPIFRAAPDVLEGPALQPLYNYVQKELTLKSPQTHIASLDLNYDGMPEYIIKSCPHDQLCNFHIIGFGADTADPVRPLGHMTGQSLQISDKSDYGVRRLMVQDNELNDFAVTYYSWNTKQSHYTQHTAP